MEFSDARAALREQIEAIRKRGYAWADRGQSLGWIGACDAILALPALAGDAEDFETGRLSSETPKLLRQVAQVIGSRELAFPDYEAISYTEAWTAGERKRIARTLITLAAKTADPPDLLTNDIHALAGEETPAVTSCPECGRGENEPCEPTCSYYDEAIDGQPAAFTVQGDAPAPKEDQ
jgi:hypothetical protein